METDLNKYPEKCQHCGQPARTELNIQDYPVGLEWFQYCVNPYCVQFDVTIRQKAEDGVKKGKAFRRWQARAWKQLIVERKERQKEMWNPSN